MRNNLITCFTIVAAFFMASSAHAGATMKVSPNIRRAGGDYTSFQVGSAKSCERACMKSARCRAFDFYMSDNSCWLKARAYPKGAYSGAVSGIKVYDPGSQGNTTATYSVELKVLQLRLNSLGYDAGTADGLMGKKTRQAIQQFQSTNGLPVTGKADRQTLGRLAQIALDGQDAGKDSSSRVSAGEDASAPPPLVEEEFAQ